MPPLTCSACARAHKFYFKFNEAAQWADFFAGLQPKKTCRSRFVTTVAAYDWTSFLTTTLVKSWVKIGGFGPILVYFGDFGTVVQTLILDWIIKGESTADYWHGTTVALHLTTALYKPFCEQYVQRGRQSKNHFLDKFGG